MIDTSILLRSVSILFIMMIPGFLMKKTKLAPDKLSLGFTNTILYMTQPAMLFLGFFRAYDSEILVNVLIVFVMAMLIHLVFYFIAKLFYHKAPESVQKVYCFGTTFANAGYMGLPLIKMILGDHAVIYATIFLIGFNFYCWSLGSYIYTKDRSYISFKSRKMFVNAATIPLALGFVFFLTNAYTVIPDAASVYIHEVLTMLSNTVAPMSMMIVGMRLADLKLKGAFKDPYLYSGFALRLLIMPLIVFLMLFICKSIGFFNKEAFVTVMICAATPCASATVMFAERFNGDTVTASKLVSLSTILSLVTIPLVSFLLSFL